MMAEHRGKCEIHLNELCEDNATRITAYSLGGALNVDVFYRGNIVDTHLFDEREEDAAIEFIKDKWFSKMG